MKIILGLVVQRDVLEENLGSGFSFLFQKVHIGIEDILFQISFVRFCV